MSSQRILEKRWTESDTLPNPDLHWDIPESLDL